MKRILFVDDEQKILEALGRSLHSLRQSWNMSFAVSGSEALELLQKKAFNIVVADLRMPGMDGAQFLEEVRNLRPDTARILLSGQSDEELVLRSMRVAHQYLAKPFDAERLKEVIERVSSLRERITNNTLKQMIFGMDSLPSIALPFKEITSFFEPSDATKERITHILCRDIGMTAKLLQLVNSTFFGLHQGISNIPRAVSFLGFNTVKSIVMAARVFPHFQMNEKPAFDLEKVWRHSLNVAAISKKIMKLEGAPGDVSDDAFAAGILHDIGKLILAMNLPNPSSAVYLDFS